VQERLAALRRDSAAAEVAECTFAPAIDGRSKSLMAQRTQALQARPCPPGAARPRRGRKVVPGANPILTHPYPTLGL